MIRGQAPLEIAGVRVDFARAGEMVVIDRIKYVLWSDCRGPASTLACITCGQYLANEGQLEMHADASSHDTHTLAAWCPKHGWEAIAR